MTRAGAFYTVGNKKVQGKEKFVTLLQEDDKLRSALEKDIQARIKEMRTGKQVLDESALDALQTPSSSKDKEETIEEAA